MKPAFLAKFSTKHSDTGDSLRGHNQKKKKKKQLNRDNFYELVIVSEIRKMASNENGNKNKSIINYDKALEYWAEVPATLDGVLGGFGHISDEDILGSNLFLKSILSSANAPATKTALDCGAGIGRITKHLLTNYYDRVDVIEPDVKFINSLLDYVGENKFKIGSLYQISLQEFKPERKYDLIWNQWVLGYLKDNDLVSFLSSCRESLSENGILVVKENVTSSGKAEIDATDSSVTRTLKQFLKIFKSAKLKRIKQCKQLNFPNGIYPVYMFALISEKN